MPQPAVRVNVVDAGCSHLAVEVDDAREEHAMGMVRRRTRRRTMLVAGGAAYAVGRHQGKKAGYEDAQNEYVEEEPPPPTYQEIPPAPPPPAPTEAVATDADQLQKLADLHASGVLSDDEFTAAKAKVLGI
jgi:Short C-terminal domain